MVVMIKRTHKFPVIILYVLSHIVITNFVFAKDYIPGSETSFTLVKPITIPARSSSIYIQKNVVTRDESRIDFYYANCLFEQATLAKNDEIIKPDKFNVSETRLSRIPETQNLFEYQTLFYLTSEKTNKKYTLECQHWGEWSDWYLTREQIQDTIKVYFKINP